tara:strand:- start:60 stop:425 length:366 start_codon:yes stop_codon:yes gene_type:complete
MYISDTNYAEAIANLEDCMFALMSMHFQTQEKGYATKEDLAYVEPRFTEALRYILELNKHPIHSQSFKHYLTKQFNEGARVYEALGKQIPAGDFTDHIAHILHKLVQIQKKESDIKWRNIK